MVPVRDAGLPGAGAAACVAAVLVFLLTYAVSLRTAGSAYVWDVNMISDLGDSACGTRGGRWICSPGYAVFNAGLLLTGVLLAAAAACLRRLWGPVLAGSIAVMGAGLVVAAVFNAGDAPRLHLVGVVLALVVPGLGLLLSAARPRTAWLHAGRRTRGGLAVVALLLCLDSRLPAPSVPQGAGELVLVGCLMLALLVEAGRVLLRARAAAPAPSLSR